MLDIALSQAISLIKTNKGPIICFLCVRNPQLPICERTALYTTCSSLSRYFLRKHVRKLEEWEQLIVTFATLDLSVDSIYRTTQRNFTELSYSEILNITTTQYIV
jgi:hypothetical protein